MLKIDLTDLLREVGRELDLEEEEKASYPQNGLSLVEPVRIKAHLTNTGTSVLLRGSAQTRARLNCDRCSKEFTAPISAKIEEEFSVLPREPKRGKEIELKEGDFIYELEEGKILDLSEIVRQNLILVLPLQALCEEKCKGE